MSEIICPLCNNQSPEQALYCQYCGQPIRCKGCGAELLPSARACIQCGKLIPERSTNEQFHIGRNLVPPGYNHLKLHETPDVRDVDLTVSNEAIQHIGDLLPSLVGTRPKGHYANRVDPQQQKQPDVVDITSEIPAPQPQLPAVSSLSTQPKNSPETLIWQIFRKQDDGGIKQDIRNLKAASKRDYILRLIYLYLYVKIQLGESNVSRSEVYAFLDHAGLKDTNTSSYMSHAHGIISEDGTLRLAFEGRKIAEQYIADIFDQDLVDGWPTTPSSDARSANTRPKKPGKKGDDRKNSSDAEIARWTSHPSMKEIINTVEHGTIVDLPLVDQALLALYGIYNTGHEQEISLTLIIKCLYSAFDVPVKSNSLSKTLHSIRKSKTAKASYINFRDGHGYKITQSGRKYIEDSLKLK